ncbi:protein odr-4 homolog [Nephila pilipes]|uniref:Protein odr-4 homolog n=1 Tax=Nephila pilipes TaxID=299642 RepID=A0A8X6MQ85_NEPPI|nr:protein odr-4 homolog [Nephila pilipes]
MGRLITYDCIVQEKLNSIAKLKAVQTGLIIGQYTDQKDFAIRLCPTPQKDDNEDTKSGDTQKKSKKKSDDPIELDEVWICQHAKQLLRALPGGLNILGFYIAAPSDYNTKQQAQLRQILYAIFKTISKNQKLALGTKERVLLNICTVTSKIVCRTFDVTDLKSFANPADWKLQSGSVRWQQVRCQLAVDIKFPIKKENGSLSLQKQIEIGLIPFLKSIQDAHSLLNGVQRESDELLNISKESKKSKKKQSNDKIDRSPVEWHNIELFIPLENNNDINPEILDCTCMMICKGAVQCRAYVHGKATVEDAINALKQDIIRSVLARCEIHCEDLLLIEEEQKDPLVVHELPRRVFACLPQGDICVCDYQFHSDTPSDSLDAFKELLDLDLTEQDIDTSCEVSPTTSALILPEVMDDRLSEFGDVSSHSPMNMYVPVAGVIVAIAVGVASYIQHFNSS